MTSTTTDGEKAVPVRSAKRALVGRLSWGLADQAASSISNFAVGIYVARSLGVTAFGVFSLAWVTYGVVLNVSRGLATDPLVVRFSGVPQASWRGAVARSTGTAVCVGTALGVLCLAAGLGLGGRVGPAFAALGLMMPGLLLQDAWRFSFFAAGDGRKAFVNDIVWGIALIPAMVVAAHVDTVAAFVLAWGASATVAAGYGCIQSGIRPRPAWARGWLREQRDLGYRYLVENVSLSGASQLRAYGLGVIVGVSAVGAVRGAELLLGPFLAVLMGLSPVTVPEAARVPRQAPQRLGRLPASTSAGTGHRRPALRGSGAPPSCRARLGELALGDVWHSLLAPHRADHPQRRRSGPRHRRRSRTARARSRPPQSALPAVRLRLLRRRRTRRSGPRRYGRLGRGVAAATISGGSRPRGGCNCAPPCASTTANPSPK
ncbi:hypothetical protein ACRAWF_37645 [Streptomyces sp. L7]